MDETDLELLARYDRDKAEDAFAELVRRHLSMVYSAALRQVRSQHLAEEVAQSAFLKLARQAGQLKAHGVLPAWLHQVTRREAIDVVRREASRHLREQIAFERNASDANASDWQQIEPLLDEAMDSLDENDRHAVLLRYFENKPLRAVGQSLGVSDDAAQKRVSRAVERLREFLVRRGVTVGLSGLIAAISANALQAVPVGLSSFITSATIAGTFGASAFATASKIIVMTTLQKTLVAAVLVAAITTGIYEARQASISERRIQRLLQDQQPLVSQIESFAREQDNLKNALAAVQKENEHLRQDAAEVARLRGEVARLRSDARERPLLNATGASKGNDAMESAMKSWLVKVERLKKSLERMPEKTIPELQLLSENAWLDAARMEKLEDEEGLRKALSYLREQAKREFSKRIWQALVAYTQANNGTLPADMTALGPHFGEPVDPVTLQRYQVMQAGNLDDVSPNSALIAERAPVDENYDTLYKIGRYGYTYHGTGSQRGMSGSGGFVAGVGSGKFPE